MKNQIWRFKIIFHSLIKDEADFFIGTVRAETKEQARELLNKHALMEFPKSRLIFPYESKFKKS